ncbi:hypothetical protein GUITHDRAFT_122309 [Guillardia theta CCMP2712]|uniref:Uncharacterized protein n=2 Tax=Guillardia theta (strain CCMP2712) TaxID=905079 RepID=L1I5H9_GUITC|nr:hypothetical protein GUITHDRAFT_122309 [Guillardia theta CCMP2712]EKX31496.1 hypothetical protein GUITHDRAFT_122309 [Guillardia theta CCMP2712]|eukprot:XP_005818476.1 hypothetical protein GUITHDRAFT_122309 [Guillardia theta CCMP2712]
MLYDKNLLDKVDANISKHGLQNKSMRQIVRSMNARTCFQSVYTEEVDLDLIQDVLTIQYPFLLDSMSSQAPQSRIIDVVGYIFFNEDNYNRRKPYCEISYFKLQDPEQTIKKIVSSSIEASVLTPSGYLKTVSDIEEIKNSMQLWLTARSRTFKKAGTQDLDFTCKNISMRSLLRLIPPRLFKHVKAKRNKSQFTWIFAENIVQDKAFREVLDIPFKSTPKLQENLTQMFVGGPMYLSYKRGNMSVGFETVGSIGGMMGKIQWVDWRDKKKRQQRVL